MEFLANLIPAKKHNGYKRAFEEKSHDAFNSQRGTENIANKPGIVGPIGAEFKFEDNPGSHTNGEIDTKNRHPKFGDAFPFRISGTNIQGFHKCYNEGKPKGKRHKKPMVHGCERKLCPRPVYKREIYVFHILFFREFVGC